MPVLLSVNVGLPKDVARPAAQPSPSAVHIGWSTTRNPTTRTIRVAPATILLPVSRKPHRPTTGTVTLRDPPRTEGRRDRGPAMIAAWCETLP